MTRRFEAVLYVEALNLRAAKAAVRQTIKWGPSAAEIVEDLIEQLAEVKTPSSPPNDTVFCHGCGQRHPFIEGVPHPSGDGFVCRDPHREEIPHRCGYWADRCNNGPHGKRAKAALSAKANG